VLQALVSGLGRKADDCVHVPVSKAVALAKRGVSRSLAGAQQATLASLELVSALVSNGQRRVLPWAWPLCDVVESALRICDAWGDVFVAACGVVESCAGLGVGVAARLFDSLLRPRRLRESTHECLALVGALRACLEAANGYANDSARDDLARMLLPTDLLSAHGSAVDLLGLLATTTDNADVRRQCWTALKALTSTWRVAAAARRALASVELGGLGGHAAAAPVVAPVAAPVPSLAKKLKVAAASPLSAPVPAAPAPVAPVAPVALAAPAEPVPPPVAPPSSTSTRTRESDDDDIPDIV